MKVTINVDGMKREFDGDYHTLHNNDWNEIVRSGLDESEEVRASVAKDHFDGEKINQT